MSSKTIDIPMEVSIIEPLSLLDLSFLYREIIVYSRSTINAYSLLSHEWWVLLIKFMVGPTIHMKKGSAHLRYSGST